MTEKRTDVHRPSMPDFDPEMYRLIDVYDLQIPPVELVYNWRGEVVEQFDTPEWLLWWKVAESLKESGVNRAAHSTGHRCGHCGASIRYAAIMVRDDLNEWIFVGQQCLDNRFSGMTKAGFKKLRDAAKSRNAAEKRQQEFNNRIEKMAAENPLLAVLADYQEVAKLKNPFLYDLRDKLFRFDLSQAQKAAAIRAIERAKQWEKEREERKANSIPAPKGRGVVTGEVLKVALKESFYGAVMKWTVRDDRGFTVWGSIPSLIEREVEKGERVTFKATLEPSEDDETFAFAKRPSNAEIISHNKERDVEDQSDASIRVYTMEDVSFDPPESR